MIHGEVGSVSVTIYATSQCRTAWCSVSTQALEVSCSGTEKRVVLLQDMKIFFKVLALISIWKCFRERLLSEGKKKSFRSHAVEK